MYLETFYSRDNQPLKVLITCPHASLGENFFQRFSEILKHSKVAEIKKLFLQYIEVEADIGSDKIAHGIAKILKENGISCLVFEMDYPRAIVDGGRILDHCIRDSLPSELMKKLKNRFLNMHQKTLQTLARYHKKIKENNGLVLDVHTMASFSPACNGKIQTKAVSFESLESYLNQFINVIKDPYHLRNFDLITEDGSGNSIGDHKLADILRRNLAGSNIPFKENDPYAALPAFLMHTHLSSCQSVAIDIPKHMISRCEDAMEFDIIDFQVDDKKIKDLTVLIAESLIERVYESQR